MCVLVTHMTHTRGYGQSDSIERGDEKIGERRERQVMTSDRDRASRGSHLEQSLLVLLKHCKETRCETATSRLRLAVEMC